MIRAPTRSHLPAYLVAALVGAAIGALCLIAPPVAAVAVLGVGFLLVVLHHPIVLCYVMVAAITLLSGVPRGFVVPLVRLNELALVLCAGLGLLLVLADRGLARNLARASFVIGAFVVLAVGTIIVPTIYHYGGGRPATIDGLLEMVSPLKFVVLFLLFTAIPRGPEEWRPLIVWMVACSTLVGLVGLLQAARFEPVLLLIGSWYDSVHTEASINALDGRVTSLIGAWNALGMLLMITIAIGWAALQVPEMRPYRAVLVAGIVICFLCLVASGSFAGIASMVLTIMLIELLTSPPARTLRRLLVAAGIAGVVIVAALPVIGTVVLGRVEWQFGHANLLPQTFVYRFWIWSDVFWPAIVANPLLGTSLDIPGHYRWLFAESHYVSLLFRFGLVGLLAHLLWAGLMLAWLLPRAREGDRLTRAMAATAFGALTALLIASVTNEVFLFTGSIDYLWILFAVVASRGGLDGGAAPQIESMR